MSHRFQLLLIGISGVSCGNSADPGEGSATTLSTTLGNTASTSGAVVTSVAAATGSETNTVSVSGVGATDMAASSATSVGGATSTTFSASSGESGASSGPTASMSVSGAMTTGGAGGTGGTPVDEACAMPPLAAGNTNRTVEVGGQQRTFIVHVPETYTGTTRVPLVLDFHPLGGTGSQEQSSSGYQRIADREGFLIAFPDGIDNAWNVGPCCTNSREVDDLGFAQAMIESIAADGCVDRKRLYAVGFSMGGGMSHYLACNAADIFAAVAPAAFDLLIADEMPCAPSRPISVLAFRGTNDTTVPFAGGLGPSGRITFLGAQASFERWAELDGCTMPSASDGDCTYYSECDGGAEVGLCVAEGGGHATGDADIGWEFLSKFSLP